jgi:hypothetical protein
MSHYYSRGRQIIVLHPIGLIHSWLETRNLRMAIICYEKFRIWLEIAISRPVGLISSGLSDFNRTIKSTIKIPLLDVIGTLLKRESLETRLSHSIIQSFNHTIIQSFWIQKIPIGDRSNWKS